MNTTSHAKSLSFNDSWIGFIRTCFRPLIKILIKNKVEFKSFIGICRDLYIEEAECYISKNSNDKRGKISSIAYQTGLDRREVSKLLKEKPNDSDLTESNRSRESSILDHWKADSLFCDNNGKPVPLKRSGSGLSFETLVQRFGKNISHGPILNELMLSKCVDIQKGKVHFITNEYTPSATSDTKKINIASLSMNRLATTLAHNLSKHENLLFQRNLYSIRIDKKQIGKFQLEVSKMLNEALINNITPLFDDIEEKYQTNIKSEQSGPIGLGLFYFQQTETENIS